MATTQFGSDCRPTARSTFAGASSRFLVVHGARLRPGLDAARSGDRIPPHRGAQAAHLHPGNGPLLGHGFFVISGYCIHQSGRAPETGRAIPSQDLPGCESYADPATLLRGSLVRRRRGGTGRLVPPDYSGPTGWSAPRWERNSLSPRTSCRRTARSRPRGALRTSSSTTCFTEYWPGLASAEGRWTGLGRHIALPGGRGRSTTALLIRGEDEFVLGAGLLFGLGPELVHGRLGRRPCAVDSALGLAHTRPEAGQPFWR